MSTPFPYTPEELQEARRRQALSHQYGRQYDRVLFRVFVAIHVVCFAACTLWGAAHAGVLDGLYGGLVLTLTLFTGLVCLMITPDGWADTLYYRGRDWYAQRGINANTD